MTLHDIDNNCKTIREVMDREVGHDDLTSLLQKMNNLNVLQSLSAECVAQSNLIYNIKIGDLAKELKDYSATDKKLIMQGRASKEIYCMDYTSGLNKELHYQLDSIRTAISALKEEFKRTM